MDVQTLSNAWWLDWGLALTAGLQTDTVDTFSTGVDFTAGASFGLQAYLHVNALAGGNFQATLQHSNDNAVGDPYTDVTGGAFTLVTAATTGERIATTRALAIKRWLRVSTSGTFTSATFALSAVINRTEMTI
jgi:hypothetical protein